MKKDWKYILYVGSALAIFILIKLSSPKEFNWNITLAHDDKDPYGTYVLYNLLPTLNENVEVKQYYQTLYELKDTIAPKSNVVIFASRFKPGKEDVLALLKFVSEGGVAFISAQQMSGVFSDTMKVDTYDNLFSNNNYMQNSSDTVYVSLSNSRLHTFGDFGFPRHHIYNYFNKYDTARTTVVSRNHDQWPITLKVMHGKGFFILNSTPLAFTNINVLSGENDAYASGTLSYLNPSPVYWTEYYQLGRMEAQTPLRYILKTEPLAWAYYISIITLIAFMLFEAKRRQRVIPVMRPPSNSTLEFVSTIGNLYYQNANHRNIAEKKIQFLFDQIRMKYLLDTNKIDDQFMRTLAYKSGKPHHEIVSLFTDITSVLSLPKIDSQQLIDLNKKIERFYK